MRRPRALAVLPVALLLTVGLLSACGSDGDAGVTVTEAPETTPDTMAGEATTAPPGTDEAPAETTGASEDTAAPGTEPSGTGGSTASLGAWVLREEPTWEVVVQVDVTWPVPVPKDQLAINDIDQAAACRELAAAGAFPGVSGETAGDSAMREGDTLTLGCTFRTTPPPPFDLTAFADALRDGLAAAEGEGPGGMPSGTYGMIEVRLEGNPAEGLPELEGVDTRPSIACAAAAKAMGLPDGWTSGGTFTFNDDVAYRCQGPIPDAPAVTADAAIVEQVVGGKLPPKES